MTRLDSSLREEFIRTADDKEYRHGYADESLNISIATQIKVIREQRGMNQSELAQQAGMKQSVISRFENANYSSWSIRTLKRLARAFDVDLEVKFRSFGDLVKSVDTFSRKALQVPKFDEDPFFKPEQPAAQSQMGMIRSGMIQIQGAGFAANSGWHDIGHRFTTDVGSASSAANPGLMREIIMGTKRA